MCCSFQSAMAMDATILGSEGEIRIPRFHAAESAVLIRDGETIDEVNDDGGGKLCGEIEAVMDSIIAGEKECPFHTHRDTQKLAEVMDTIRGQLTPANGSE